MTKLLQNIEKKMKGLPLGSLRYHVLMSAKNFKSSWFELGRSLYSVWKDKLYKDWGYSTMDAYTGKEIGVRKQTAMKLLKSYYFLEKEEPQYLRQEVSNIEAANMPTYESIDVLRMAKSKKNLDEEDYSNLKKEVFENGKDAREAKKSLSAFIRQRQEFEPQEAYQRKRLATARRFLGTLKALKRELEISKLLPADIIKEAASLIQKLEDELS